ncbi:MAG: DUF4783 domain-containing protein [Saprospiraceae bacterium]|nr:DUF4783 domain-containing protein [Saprospiraceae bacterium]
MRYLFIFFIFLSINLQAQNDEKFFGLMRSGDINAMESYLQDKIDFCLFEDVQPLNRKAALGRFKSFLDSNRPTGLEMMHQGTSRDRSTNYRVAKLNTVNGSFRVFVYSVGPIGPNSVKEIRIDKF